MIVRKKIDFNKPLSKKQLEMLDKLKDRPIVFDDDLPNYSYEQLVKMEELAKIRRNARKKETITIRLSSNSLNKAKSLGKGYTAVLSRILEAALDDPDIVSRYL